MFKYTYIYIYKEIKIKNKLSCKNYKYNIEI